MNRKLILEVAEGFKRLSKEDRESVLLLVELLEPSAAAVEAVAPVPKMSKPKKRRLSAAVKKRIGEGVRLRAKQRLRKTALKNNKPKRPRTKITPEMDAAILRAIRAGRPLTEIATSYGVSITAIRKRAKLEAAGKGNGIPLPPPQVGRVEEEVPDESSLEEEMEVEGRGGL